MFRLLAHLITRSLNWVAVMCGCGAKYRAPAPTHTARANPRPSLLKRIFRKRTPSPEQAVPQVVAPPAKTPKRTTGYRLPKVKV